MSWPENLGFSGSGSRSASARSGCFHNCIPPSPAYLPAPSSRGETLRSLKRLIAADNDRDRDCKDGSSASNRSGMMRAGKSLEEQTICFMQGARSTIAAG